MVQTYREEQRKKVIYCSKSRLKYIEETLCGKYSTINIVGCLK